MGTRLLLLEIGVDSISRGRMLQVRHPNVGCAFYLVSRRGSSYLVHYQK